MSLFGSFIIKGKSLQAIVFTIKMAIHLIMTLGIWSLWRLRNILQFIIRKNGKSLNIGRKWLKTWIKSDILQQNGTDQKREDFGTKNMLKSFFVILKIMIINVLSVARVTKTKGLIQNYVQGNAIKNIEEDQGLIMRRENVLSAKRDLSLTNFKKLKHVQKNVKLNHTKRVERVYNLQVEDGVYYANGILVSNCDGLLFCCEYANMKKSSTCTGEESSINNTSIVGNIRDMKF
jgi:hypothetical protein